MEGTVGEFVGWVGGLWLASLTAVVESEQRCETSPASEIMSLEGHAAERITFGVRSGAALTVIGKDVATIPECETRETNDGLPRGPCGELGAERPGLEGPTGRSFARVTVASVAKNLLSVSSLLKTRHEVVFSSGRATSGISRPMRGSR